MMRRIALAFIWFGCLALPAVADTVVFVDGTRMEVKSYEVKGPTVVLTTTDGKLRSVPSALVNLEATQRANVRGGATASKAPAAPPRAVEAPKSEPPKPSARATKEPATSPPPTQPAPAQPAPPPPVQVETVTDIPAPKPLPADYPGADVGGPRTWSDDELQVSLVVPSGAWQIRDAPVSFDVAVQIDKPATEARTTLALIRRPIRNYGAFQKALVEMQNSAAQSPGFQPLQSKKINVGPYTAYEIRFLKENDGRRTFNRLVSFYSKDLIYTLSMSCPEERLADNDPDFEAFVLGIQIRKSRDELVPKGAPES